MPPVLERIVFSVSRAAEYFIVSELETMTGQDREQFSTVVLKELLDNAADACEMKAALQRYGETGETPHLLLGWHVDPDRDEVQITVADTGGGIAPETVRRIIDFDTRTSDKAMYRSPTRGAQGNAWKTVLGMPYALGVRAPVVIEAHGIRHTIVASVDPASNVHVEHTETPVATPPGTRVTLTMPTDDQECAPTHWGRGFRLFNPHLSVQICQEPHADLPCALAPSAVPGWRDLYGATVPFPGDWRKYLPQDPTSVWWYSVADLERLIYATIDARQQAGLPDRTLSDFVTEFRNLARREPVKAVSAALPGITHLRDLPQHPGAIHRLHQAMRHAGKAPSADVLGVVGEAHFRQCFVAWYGIKRERFWYTCQKDVHAGLPCSVEVAVAETLDGGTLWTGVNFSPTFVPPVAETTLEWDKVKGEGLRAFLAQRHALPSPYWARNLAVAVHLTCPSLAFLDRGKTRFSCPDWMAALLAQALWKTTRVLYADEEKRRKDAAKAQRQEKAQEKAQEREEKRQQPKMTLKDAVFQVMWDAYLHASGGEQFEVSQRFLYYPVRKMIQALVDDPLEGHYFEKLLVEYKRTVRPLPKQYYDPRGVLYEPHTGHALPLGTREVRDYLFPSWLYDKILYVEKKGVWPIIKDARLAERYDMAIVAGEGFATEAIRVLFEAASKHKQYQLFVLHDCDVSGYNIARTLREETDRMPGYQVDVIDLGLYWAEAMALGLETETLARKVALPKGLVLTEDERRAFEGEAQLGAHGRPTEEWIAQRVELNAFSAPELVAYIERRLQETGVRGKVVPPDDVLRREVADRYRSEIADLVRAEFERLLPLDAITADLVQQLTPDIPGSAARQWITPALATHPAWRWQTPLGQQVEGLAWEQRGAVRTHIRTALRAAIEDGALDETGEDEAAREDADEDDEEEAEA